MKDNQIKLKIDFSDLDELELPQIFLYDITVIVVVSNKEIVILDDLGFFFTNQMAAFLEFYNDEKTSYHVSFPNGVEFIYDLTKGANFLTRDLIKETIDLTSEQYVSYLNSLAFEFENILNLYEDKNDKSLLLVESKKLLVDFFECIDLLEEKITI